MLSPDLSIIFPFIRWPSFILSNSKQSWTFFDVPAGAEWVSQAARWQLATVRACGIDFQTNCGLTWCVVNDRGRNMAHVSTWFPSANCLQMLVLMKYLRSRQLVFFQVYAISHDFCARTNGSHWDFWLNCRVFCLPDEGQHFLKIPSSNTFSSLRTGRFRLIQRFLHGSALTVYFIQCQVKWAWI
jgi:hypothetical protein